jgi:hypothetical protein
MVISTNGATMKAHSNLTPNRSAGRKRGASAALRGAVLLGIATAVAAVAAATAQPASAHYVDRDHQHGWNTALLFDPVMRCFGPAYYGAPGSVSVAVPDLMTTPGGARKVYFRAILERYDFSIGQWVAATWNGSRWVPLGVTDWYYTVADSSGPVFGWRELSTGRYGPARIGFNVQPGYFYRFTIQFFWGYDGTQLEDKTSYCQV